MTRDEVVTQLGQYGYSLDDQDMIVTPKGNTTMMRVTVTRSKAVITAGGTRYFSGPDVGDFLEKFWFARKVA